MYFRMGPSGDMVPHSRSLDPVPVGYWRPYYPPDVEYPPHWQNRDDMVYEGLLVAAYVRKIFKKLLKTAVQNLKQG